MADSKISALPASTTPLAGTEVLPIVQSSATKQVSVANLTAGRAISAASITASTGNFVVGTSGQGIDFSATPNTGTSELFADYEEGTFNPSFANFAVGNGSVFGRYTKIGRIVHIQCGFVYGSTSSITGSIGAITLPFAASNTAANTFQMAMGSVFKPNVGWFNILSFLENNIASLALTTDFVSAPITSVSPTVFASGTTLTLAIAYEV